MSSTLLLSFFLASVEVPGLLALTSTCQNREAASANHLLMKHSHPLDASGAWDFVFNVLWYPCLTLTTVHHCRHITKPSDIDITLIFLSFFILYLCLPQVKLNSTVYIITSYLVNCYFTSTF